MTGESSCYSNLNSRLNTSQLKDHTVVFADIFTLDMTELGTDLAKHPIKTGSLSDS